ncbi:MAG: hypothetical protein ACQESN_04065 [Thermotogota bacterium]
MANIYLGGNKNKKGSKWWIWLVLIIIILGGFLFYQYNKYNNNDLYNFNKYTYAIKYREDVYFTRIINSSRRVMMVKLNDGLTFPDTKNTISTKYLNETIEVFEEQFDLSSDRVFYFELTEESLKELTSQMGSQANDMDIFFDQITDPNFSILNIFKMGKYTNIIKQQDRNSLITNESLYYFLKKLSEYSITDYKSLKIESQFEKPLIINTNDGTFERNYVDKNSYEKVRENLE